MDNPLANLIVYWIAIGYPTVSPGACPAQLLVFPALNRSESSGQPSSCPATSAGLLAGALACRPAHTRCWLQADIMAPNQQLYAGSPCTHPVLATGGHHGTKPAAMSWVALHTPGAGYRRTSWH